MGQIGGGIGSEFGGGAQMVGGGAGTGGRPVSATLLLKGREDEGAEGAESTAELRAELDAARARVAELEAHNAGLEQQLEELTAQLARDARRGELDLALAEAGAIDIGTARTLAELDIAASPGLDVPGAVEQLRRTKAYLFGRATVTPRQRVSAMGAGAESALARSAKLTELAEEAKASGDRAALLRYLRARG